MGMNAEVGAGNSFRHGTYDFGDFGGHGAAIGVTQHHPARTGVMGGFGAGERVIRIGLVAIEEVFAIHEHFLAGEDGGLHGLTDGVEIFLVGAAQRHAHMIIPGFRHKANGLGVGADQILQAGVV